MLTEQFKSIKGYEGLYEISNLGNIKSLSREIKYSAGKTIKIKERMLKPTLRTDGYLSIGLHQNNIGKTHQIHRLVYISFNGDIPKKLQIDHINDNRSDNRLSNLRLLTHRLNTARGFRHRGLPTGVIYHKQAGKYQSQINIDKKYYYLGLYDSVDTAKEAYDNKLNEAEL